jgi:chemotaxis protein MotB
MARKKKPQQSGGIASWVLTFGDCMILLLTFFVLLFSMSSIDQAKFTRIIESFKGAFGVLGHGDVVSEGQLKRAKDVKKTDDFSDEQKNENQALDEMLEEQQKREMIRELAEIQAELEALNINISVFDIPEKGIVVRIEDKTLFETGNDQWQTNYNTVLDKVSQVLEKTDRKINIEGHTDDVPIGARLREKFPTNWELSAVRATNVLRYFVERKELSPVRFSSSGYGEYRPIAPNRKNDGSPNPEGRAQNRRVDIVIMNN